MIAKKNFLVYDDFIMQISITKEDYTMSNEMNENENEILDDALENIVILNDEDGNESEFEFLDLVEYEGSDYVVLLPLIDDEDDAEEDGMVLILKVASVNEDTDEEEYVSIDDEATLNAVFEIFKEKFKDEFDFVDGE